MSEERMRELGIPRRRFLKQGAAAAFVAPAVVSFALDGVAEADSGSLPNQVCANQTFSNQFFIEEDLTQVITIMVTALGCQELGFGQASGVARQALSAAFAVASNSSNACGEMQVLINTINGLPQGGAKTEAGSFASDAFARAGCPIS